MLQRVNHATTDNVQVYCNFNNFKRNEMGELLIVFKFECLFKSFIDNNLFYCLLKLLLCKN